MKTRAILMTVAILSPIAAHAWNPYNDFSLYDVTRSAWEQSALDISFCDRRSNLSYSLQTLCDDAQWYQTNYLSCSAAYTSLQSNYNSCSSAFSSVLTQRNTVQAQFATCVDAYTRLRDQSAAVAAMLTKKSKLEKALRRACGAKCKRIK
jgi:hypothetical protein